MEILLGLIASRPQTTGNYLARKSPPRPAARNHEVAASSYLGFRSGTPTAMQLRLSYRELACFDTVGASTEFGLHHPDSSAHLVLTAKKQFERIKTVQTGVGAVLQQLLENR